MLDKMWQGKLGNMSNLPDLELELKSRRVGLYEVVSGQSLITLSATMRNL